MHNVLCQKNHPLDELGSCPLGCSSELLSLAWTARSVWQVPHVYSLMGWCSRRSYGAPHPTHWHGTSGSGSVSPHQLPSEAPAPSLWLLRSFHPVGGPCGMQLDDLSPAISTVFYEKSPDPWRQNSRGLNHLPHHSTQLSAFLPDCSPHAPEESVLHPGKIQKVARGNITSKLVERQEEDALLFSLPTRRGEGWEVQLPKG